MTVQVAEISRSPRTSCALTAEPGSRGGEPGRRRIDRKVAHFKHLLDGRDAGDGVLAELADAVGERAEELVANVHGAAAHARYDPGVFGLGAVELGQNHIFAGSASAAKDAEDLHLHGLGDRPLKDGPGGGDKAAMDLAEGEDSAGADRRPSQGRGILDWSTLRRRLLC